MPIAAGALSLWIGSLLIVGLVDRVSGALAGHANDVRHLTDIAHDLREMRTVADLEQERQHRHIVVAAKNLDLLDVGVAVSDRRCNLGEYAGFVLRIDLVLLVSNS